MAIPTTQLGTSPLWTESSRFVPYFQTVTYRPVVALSPVRVLGGNSSRYAVIFANAYGPGYGVANTAVGSASDATLLIDTARNEKLTFQEFGGMVTDAWYVIPDAFPPSPVITEIIYRPPICSPFARQRCPSRSAARLPAPSSEAPRVSISPGQASAIQRQVDLLLQQSRAALPLR